MRCCDTKQQFEAFGYCTKHPNGQGPPVRTVPIIQSLEEIPSFMLGEQVPIIQSLEETPSFMLGERVPVIQSLEEIPTFMLGERDRSSSCDS